MLPWYETPFYRVGKSPESVAMSTHAPVNPPFPDGDTRLVCNVRSDLHIKLKHVAVDERTTIGQIVERLIDKHL